MSEIGNKLKLPLALTILILLAELIGGLLTGSLALLSDAVHMATDSLALFFSWYTIKISTKFPSSERTFGYHRTEVLAAFANGLLLLGIAIGIIFEAYKRFSTPVEIAGPEVIIIASIGLLINLFVLNRLHGSHDLNIKSAFWHVLSDTLTSVAVIIGTIWIIYTDQYFIDPALSIIIAILILISSTRIIRDASRILLDFTPKGISLEKVIREMEKVSHVKEVHEVFFRSLCSNVNTLEAHIVTNLDNLKDTHKIDCELRDKLAKFGIKHTTFQFETPGLKTCDSEEKLRNIEH